MRVSRRDLFFPVLVGVAGLHLALLALLLRVEPEARSFELAQRVARYGPPPLSPEPKVALRWATDARDGTLHIKSTDALHPDELAELSARFSEIYALFTEVETLPPLPLPPLELRIVSVLDLNDRRLFWIGHRKGTYYGRYFAGASIAYLTPLLWRYPEHLAHELAHHFAWAHGVRGDRFHEEARASRFEEIYLAYLEGLRNPHVLAGGLETSPARHRVELEHLVFTSERRMPKDVIERLDLVREDVEAMFPSFAQVPALPPVRWRVNVSRAEAMLDDESVTPPGFYDRDADVLRLTPAQLRDSASLLHVMGHRMIHRYALELTPQQEEAMALAFRLAVERAWGAMPLRVSPAL